MSFLEKLKSAHDDHGWDLAQLCIETCGQPIERLAAASQATGPHSTCDSRSVTDGHVPIVDAPAQQEHAESGGRPLTGEQTLALSLDIPWDPLWDDLLEPWQPSDLTYSVNILAGHRASTVQYEAQPGSPDHSTIYQRPKSSCRAHAFRCAGREVSVTHN